MGPSARIWPKDNFRANSRTGTTPWYKKESHNYCDNLAPLKLSFSVHPAGLSLKVFQFWIIFGIPQLVCFAEWSTLEQQEGQRGTRIIWFLWVTPRLPDPPPSPRIRIASHAALSSDPPPFISNSLYLISSSSNCYGWFTFKKKKTVMVDFSSPWTLNRTLILHFPNDIQDYARLSNKKLRLI